MGNPCIPNYTGHFVSWRWGRSLSAQVQIVAPVIPPIDGHARMRWLLDENLSIASELDDIAVGGAETLLKTPKRIWHALGRFR